jgi:hypothetical protein
MTGFSRNSRIFTQIASLAQEEALRPCCSEVNAEMIMNCASEKGKELSERGSQRSASGLCRRINRDESTIASESG